MNTYVYPAVFHPNADGSITVTFPDLPGCISEGQDISGAVTMAQSALAQWVEYLKESGTGIPAPGDIRALVLEAGEFSTLIRAEVKDGRAVKRTVSIPKWMDDKVSESGLSLSRVLQDALRDRLGA